MVLKELNHNDIGLPFTTVLFAVKHGLVTYDPIHLRITNYSKTALRLARNYNHMKNQKGFGQRLFDAATDSVSAMECYQSRPGS
jgi:hypothetical protein